MEQCRPNRWGEARLARKKRNPKHDPLDRTFPVPKRNQLLDEIESAPSIQDRVRGQYLKGLHQIPGRNLIAYYSG